MSFLKDLDNLLNTNTSINLSDDENNHDAKLVDSNDEDFNLDKNFQAQSKKRKLTSAVELSEKKYQGKEVKFDDLSANQDHDFSDSGSEVDEDVMEAFFDVEGESEEEDEQEEEKITKRAASDDEPSDASSIEESDENDEEEQSVEQTTQPDLFQSNTSTLTTAQHIKLQLKIIDHLYNSRIKLEKVMKDMSNFDDDENSNASKNSKFNKKLSSLKICIKKFEKIIEILEEIDGRSSESLIEGCFEKTKVLSNFSKLEKSPNVQIDEILGDRERLVKRTQRKRKIVDDEEEGEEEITHDPATFNDTDFYAELLKQFIQSKSHQNNSSSDIQKKWLELEKNRKKNKKKFLITSKDRKGKKINYKVHSKLINFVAPNERFSPSYSHEGRNALFCSLFQ